MRPELRGAEAEIGGRLFSASLLELENAVIGVFSEGPPRLGTLAPARAPSARHLEAQFGARVHRPLPGQRLSLDSL